MATKFIELLIKCFYLRKFASAFCGLSKTKYANVKIRLNRIEVELYIYKEICNISTNAFGT